MTPDDVQQGLHWHRMGRLDEAARIYQGVLEREPDNADALYLLGVVALRTGQPARAAELLGRAVALRPGQGAAPGPAVCPGLSQPGPGAARRGPAGGGPGLVRPGLVPRAHLAALPRRLRRRPGRAGPLRRGGAAPGGGAAARTRLRGGLGPP